MNTSEANSSDHDHRLPLSSSLNYLVALFSVIGVLVNLLVLALCLRHARQNTYIWFILNLALADAVTAFLGIFLVQESLLDNDTICRIIPATGVVTLGVTISSHPLLGVNRYVAIERAAWYPRIFDNRLVIFVLLLISWLIPIVFAIVDYQAGCFERDELVADDLSCFLNAKPGQQGCLLPKVVHTFICYATLIFCYCKVYLSLRRQKQQLASSGLNNSRLASDQQLLKLMALHALVPIVIHLPALAVATMLPEIRVQYRLAGKVIIFFLSTETVLDAILTLFIVKLFRSAVLLKIRQLWALLRCRKGTGEGPGGATMTKVSTFRMPAVCN